MQIQTPEQRSKELQQAQQALADVQDEHKAALREIRILRENMHQANTGLTDPDSDSGRRERARVAELRERIGKAIKRRDQAREKLEQAKNENRKAEAAACSMLVEDHRQAWAKPLKAFIVARLERIADEAAAVSNLHEIRIGLETALGIRRQSKLAALPLAFDLPQQFEKVERARQETQELIDAGIITAKDVPAQLRKQWRL